MKLLDVRKFASPETYISGMTALSIPDAGRIGGDWHFIAALCRPNSRIQSAGANGNMANTNAFLGQRMIADKAEVLRRRGIDLGTATHVFCATHPRAIADLLYNSLAKDIYPAHVAVDGGIFEEDIEFAMLDELMKRMAPHLTARQLENLLRWKSEHFAPVKDGVAA
jgi:hypothetical protein